MPSDRPLTMMTRRAFSVTLLGAMAAPVVGRAFAQTPTNIRSRIADLSQLHAILVQRGEEIIVSEAPRGPGLDRVANIKSCSKSIIVC